jgi:hypothetical protein
VDDDLQVLPPSTGGLHCGNFLIQGGAADLMVLPPVNGGLHCGSMPWPN